MRRFGIFFEPSENGVRRCSLKLLPPLADSLDMALGDTYGDWTFDRKEAVLRNRYSDVSMRLRPMTTSASILWAVLEAHKAHRGLRCGEGKPGGDMDGLLLALDLLLDPMALHCKAGLEVAEAEKSCAYPFSHWTHH